VLLPWQSAYDARRPDLLKRHPKNDGCAYTGISVPVFEIHPMVREYSTPTLAKFFGWQLDIGRVLVALVCVASGHRSP
jgi:hypothetical protein